MIPETVNQGQNLGRHSRFYFHFYSFLFCSFYISLEKKNVFLGKISRLTKIYRHYLSQLAFARFIFKGSLLFLLFVNFLFYLLFYFMVFVHKNHFEG
jgi:hypothetical protein